MPKKLLVVLEGAAPSGRRHIGSLLLCRPVDAKDDPVRRREMEKGYSRGAVPADVLCRRYEVLRLKSEALDAANTRMPYAERERLAEARVAVVGCGALGSGVAQLLAKSGVGHVILVDPETLGWENIRRHELGAGYVGRKKARSLAMAIAQENPDIGSTEPFDMTVQALLGSDPGKLTSSDLIVACTGSWSADAALDHHLSLNGGPPVVYAWMEAHALASHAVLLMQPDSFARGFDPAGMPRLTASETRKPAPPGCGDLTSPFGAVELGHAETLASRLALDFLRGKVARTIWRTWLTDAESLQDAEGTWTHAWIAERGQPSPLGGMTTGNWWE
jgi:hypothetical protein